MGNGKKFKANASVSTVNYVIDENNSVYNESYSTLNDNEDIDYEYTYSNNSMFDMENEYDVLFPQQTDFDAKVSKFISGTIYSAISIVAVIVIKITLIK